MNYARLILAALAAFIYVFAFDLIYHGVLLKAIYESTAEIWRPPEQMRAFIPLAVSIQFSFALMMAIIFSSFGKGEGLTEGVRFGALMGMMLGLLQVGMYTYLPVPLEMAGAWFAGSFFEALGAGMLIGLIYKRA
jgi:hypothetical protein